MSQPPSDDLGHVGLDNSQGDRKGEPGLLLPLNPDSFDLLVGVVLGRGRRHGEGG